MDSTKKVTPQNKSERKIRVIPLEKLTDKSEKLPVRHSTRPNAGSNLYTRKIKAITEPGLSQIAKRRRITNSSEESKRDDGSEVDNRAENGSLEESSDSSTSSDSDESTELITKTKTGKKGQCKTNKSKTTKAPLETSSSLCKIVDYKIIKKGNDDDVDTNIICEVGANTTEGVDKSSKTKKGPGRPGLGSRKKECETLLIADEAILGKESDISLDILFDIQTSEPKKGRGRPKGEDQVVIHHNTKYYKMKNKPGRGVLCVKCNNLISEYFWPKHNMINHNNLAWRDGDTPTNLASRDDVFKLWTQVIKNKLSLRCSRCGDKKLSALGFYSHVKICGKNRSEIESQKITCDICGSKILAVSLKSHILLTHRQREPKPIPESIIVDGDKKREAANKALDRFKSLELDGESILDMYSFENRWPAIPSYFLNLYKAQISDSPANKAKCESPGCQYQSASVDEMVAHYESCPCALEKQFSCKLCNYVSLARKEILGHIRSNHIHKVYKSSNNDYLYNCDMDLSSVKSRREYSSGGIVKHCYRFDFLSEGRETIYLDSSFSPTYLWTTKFRSSHYSDLLFSEHLTNLVLRWEKIDKNFDKYLPKVKKSIPTSRVLMEARMIDVRKHEHSWKEFDLFEVDFSSDVVTLFCGGSVRSLAWVPIPESLSANSEQYLAVSCKSDMNSFHKVGTKYSKPGLIQIWNMGVLNNLDEFKQTPVLSFGIAHNYGVVWHMEWCPSGCYQEGARLGLLALAASDSFVYIVSVPFPNQLSSSDSGDNNLQIYSTRPLFKLYLQEEFSQLLGDAEYQVTKLTWSKLSGHNVIAAGYTNGMVAVWDLQSTSPLLRETKNDVISLFPYLSFQAHVGPVTVVDFANLNEPRWLFTASHDQTSKFWDLNDVKYPFSENKRGLATDGFWVPHWNCGIICCDDVFTQYLTITSVIACRDFGYKAMPIFRTNSACTCMAANEWLNGIAQGSVAGEWQLSFQHQMFYGLEYEKTLRLRRILGGFTKYLDRSKTAEELIEYDRKKEILAQKDLQEFSKLSDDEIEVLPFLYEDAAKKYGVVFCDFNLTNQDLIPQESYKKLRVGETMEEFPYDMYPIISMNKMAWNPNKNSFRYIAIGYEAGFVRLQCVKFIKCKYEVH